MYVVYYNRQANNKYSKLQIQRAIRAREVPKDQYRLCPKGRTALKSLNDESKASFPRDVTLLSESLLQL